MSQSPFDNPFTGGGMSGGMPSGPNPAAGKVSIPAILLIVAGVIGLVHGLITIVVGLTGAGAAAIQAPPEMQGDAEAMKMFEMIQNLQGPMAIGIGALMLLIAAVVILGGIKMKTLSSYGLAMTGAILAMIPCSYGCCVGLPIGIWSIVVLMSPDVKAAFR